MTTAADIRAQYEEKLWRVLDSSVQFSASGMTHLAAGESMRIGVLLDEIARKGWAVRLVIGPSGTAGLHFYPLTKDGKTHSGDSELSSLTDRELLVKLSDMFYGYDRRRDDELDFLDKHPNREAWDDSEREAYKEIVDDIKEKYAELAKLLDYVDMTRRDTPDMLANKLTTKGQ